MKLCNCQQCGNSPQIIDTIGGFGFNAIQIVCTTCGTKTKKHITEGGRFENGGFVPITKEWAIKQAATEWNKYTAKGEEEILIKFWKPEQETT